MSQSQCELKTFEKEIDLIKKCRDSIVSGNYFAWEFDSKVLSNEFWEYVEKIEINMNDSDESEYFGLDAELITCNDILDILKREKIKEILK